MTTTSSRPPAKSKASMMKRRFEAERAAGFARRNMLVTSDVLDNMRGIAAEMGCHVEDLAGALTTVAIKNGLTSDPETRQRLFAVLDTNAKRLGRPTPLAAQEQLELAS